jgi:alkane 1-monooxygenase
MKTFATAHPGPSDGLSPLMKYGFLSFLFVPTLPLLSLALGAATGAWNLFAFLTPFVYFVAIPLLDRLIGQDRRNPSADDEARLATSRLHKALPLLCLPLQLAALAVGLWGLLYAPLSAVGLLGWTISIGFIGGVVGINVGHELIHKNTRAERAAGGLLLASVGYASFKVEHIYGHHVHVATPRDVSTSQRGQSVYAFLARALTHNAPAAFALEHANAARRGSAWRWWRSELVGLYALTAALAVLFTLAAGAAGLAFFVGQCLFAIVLLEIVNYLEHYGLARRIVGETAGQPRYERVTPLHSWNSDYLLTNWFLFNLQRHSDHHAYAARRYPLLRHFDESPQLPFGYATMILVALVPPLWRRVMDPLVDRWTAERDREAARSA